MFEGTNSRRIEVVLPTRIGYERIAMDCSASFAKYWGTVDERIEDLKTAVAEACLNAMEHGNKGRPDAKVVITMDLKEDLMTVQVQDEGEGIADMPGDPDIRKKIEKLEPARGLGLFLMKNLMDQVELNEVTEQGHIVRMSIRLENPQPVS